jgi:WD40 repeat protein
MNLELRCCMQKHSSAVYALAFNPAGTLLVSGDFHGEMCLWEPGTGTLVSMLRASTEGYEDSIFALAVSPDGSVLAAARRGFQLWNVATRTEFFTHQAVDVSSLAWNPDGTLFACGNDVVTIRDGKGGEAYRVLRGPTDWLLNLAWNSDGRLLAAGSGIEDGRVFVWEVETERVRAVLPDKRMSAATAIDLVFEEDDRLLITGGYGRLLRWHIATDHVETLFDAHAGEFPTIISRDGRLAVYVAKEKERSGEESFSLHVVEVLKGRELAESKTSHDEITCMALSGDNGLLATADAVGRLCIWALRSHTDTV